MIQETTNYALFKAIVSNREVDERHVNRLMVAINTKNMLHLNPILCNQNYEVIDGQHRLEAATRLSIPIYYLIDENISKSDIATINSHAKNWSVMDYINYWTIEKRPGFDKLSAFLSANPQIAPSTAMQMMSADALRNTIGVKSGSINTGNYEEACAIAEILKYYRNLIDFAYERYFVLAVITCYQTPGYDHDIMKKKLEFQSRSLVRCISKKQYTELLEEIYNYKSSANRLKIIS